MYRSSMERIQRGGRGSGRRGAESRPQPELTAEHRGASSYRTPEEYLREIGIEEGADVEARQLADLFRAHPELQEGIIINYKRDLKRTVIDDHMVNLTGEADRFGMGREARASSPMRSGPGRMSIFRDVIARQNRRAKWNGNAEAIQPTEREQLYGDDQLNRCVAEIEFPVTTVVGEDGSIVLLISAERGTTEILRESAKSYAHTVDGVFRFDALMHKKDRLSPKAPLHSQDSLTVTYDSVRQLIAECIARPEADCSRAHAKVDAFAQEFGIAPEEVRKLKDAITTFATDHCPLLPPEHSSDYVGRCRTVPGLFSSFCEQHGIPDMGTDTYGDNDTFFHRVNVWNGIAIDWTARQYREYRGDEYPRIYDIREPILGYRKPHSQYSKRELESILGKGGFVPYDERM